MKNFFIGMLCGVGIVGLVGFLLIPRTATVVPPVQPTVVPTEESLISRFEVTGIFIGECEPIELFNPLCSFRMRIETTTSNKVESGISYIFVSRDKDMEEVRDGERIWVSCVRHNPGKYRCDFRGFQ